MLKIIFFCILFINTIYFSFSQEKAEIKTDSIKSENIFTYLTNTSKNNTRLIINQSVKIEAMLKKHIAISKKQKTVTGYRIRIFSDVGYNSRKGANTTRTLFMKTFPDIASYIVFDNPNFKVVVGDFRTKSEALKFLMTMKEDFPSAFIIKDFIETSL